MIQCSTFSLSFILVIQFELVKYPSLTKLKLHLPFIPSSLSYRSAITIFPQRTDGKHDFRVWNAQLMSYAGYKMEDGSVVGDPVNVEFTEVIE